MIISEIMTMDVVTVDMDSSIRVISQIFQEKNFHHLLVAKNQKLMGVISDRDFIKCLSPFLHSMSEREQDRSTLNTKAHQIMSKHLITVTKMTPVEEAKELLLKYNVSCLPVVSEDGHVEGIVTWKDFLRWSDFLKL